MSYVLTDPLVETFYAHRIKRINIDLPNNKHLVTFVDLDANNNEVRERTLPLPIFDDFGNIILPNDWPETNPTGAQMYSLIEQFIYMALSDQPGGNGIGPGTIVND